MTEILNRKLPGYVPLSVLEEKYGVKPEETSGKVMSMTLPDAIGAYLESEDYTDKDVSAQTFILELLRYQRIKELAINQIMEGIALEVPFNLLSAKKEVLLDFDGQVMEYNLHQLRVQGREFRKVRKASLSGSRHFKGNHEFDRTHTWR